MSLVLGTTCLYVLIFVLQTFSLFFSSQKIIKVKQKCRHIHTNSSGTAYNARFTVFTVVLSDVLKNCNAYVFRIKNSLKIKALQSFERLGTPHPTTRCHIPEDFDLQGTVNF
jgi:hypothetical protein